MKTQGLKQALDKYGFNAAFGGARRDEEKSRAKERIFSFRSEQHRWDPKNQRPELWSVYNTRMHKGESLRVFPMSNWTELDIWQYIYLNDIPIVPLYFAAERPVVERDGTLIMVDDDRMPLRAGETADAEEGALSHARLLSTDRGRGERRGHAARDHPGNAADDYLRTTGSHDRPRPVGFHGKEEAGGVFLMAHISDLIATDIQAYLHAHEHKSLLRFITCGSVDDGKSTLIGRLLYDSKMIFEDQLTALEADSKKVGTQGGELDFALLVDGLAAEREQGITIDVAYRFFSTDKRKFIVADTPGHEQYTRNMVTGASNADLAVILIDARKGVLTQTRRHSYLVSLLGIRKVVLAINKMDLMGYAQSTFDAILEEYQDFAQQIGLTDIVAIPVSGLRGDNITEPQREHAVVPRPDVDGLPRNGGCRRRRAATPAAPAGAMGQPPEPRLPWFRRHDRQRHGPQGRDDSGAAFGTAEHRHAHRHDGWRPRFCRGRPGRDPRARRRDRHQPRRRHRHAAGPAGCGRSVRGRDRLDGGRAHAAGAAVLAEDRHQAGDRHDHRAEVQGERQHDSSTSRRRSSS